MVKYILGTSIYFKLSALLVVLCLTNVILAQNDLPLAADSVVKLTPIESPLLDSTFIKTNVTQNTISSYSEKKSNKGVFAVMLSAMLILGIVRLANYKEIRTIWPSVLSIKQSEQNFQIHEARNYLYIITLGVLGILFGAYYWHTSIWRLLLGNAGVGVNHLVVFAVYFLFFSMFEIFTAFWYYTIVNKIKVGEFGFYNYMLFAAIKLFVVLPSLFFILYGTPQVAFIAFYVSVGLLLLITILASLREVRIALRSRVSLLNVHFFLYICTLKILPLIIFIKVVGQHYGLKFF